MVVVSGESGEWSEVSDQRVNRPATVAKGKAIGMTTIFAKDTWQV